MSEVRKVLLLCLVISMMNMAVGAGMIVFVSTMAEPEEAEVQIEKDRDLTPAWRLEKIKWDFEEPPGLVIYRLTDDNEIYEDYMIIESHHDSAATVELRKKE